MTLILSLQACEQFARTNISENPGGSQKIIVFSRPKDFVQTQVVFVTSSANLAIIQLPYSTPLQPSPQMVFPQKSLLLLTSFLLCPVPVSSHSRLILLQLSHSLV